MTVLGMWLRRGLGPPLFLALSGFVLTSLLTQPDWRVELDWATRLSAASLLVVCPCVAAAAAFDTSRRFRPALADLSRGSTRSSLHIGYPALSIALWSVLAYVLTWVVAAVLVAVRGGIGVTDWWVFGEVVLPLLAASMVGLLLGMVAGPRSAAPAAAVAVIGALVVASPFGRGPFEAVTTYGTMTGLERPAARAVTVMIGVSAVAIAAFLGAREVHRPDAPRTLVLGGVAVAMLAGAILPSALPWRVDVLDVTREPYACVGERPAVCGPRSRLPILEPVQASFADAYRTLEGSAFVSPPSFRVTRYGQYSRLGASAPLDFDPAFIQDGRYDEGAVARALVRPHECRELFDAETAGPIIEAQDRVLAWLEPVLRGEIPPRPVPDEVRSSFGIVEDCEPMTRDWNWT